MSPMEQRVVIAQACGWTRIHTSARTGYVGDDQKGNYADLPDYLSNLNAMHEAEMTLSELSPGKDDKGDQLPSDKARFRMELCIICMNAGGPIHATASQRAEAFLSTLGKWTEPKSP